ncbi:hypothetical protein N7478_006605 [Penicillium angulare]|uniref:uncharacterized protein n=1 Tax=Penicillium angulare TaxID=116970 RepID=UPI002540A13D|nr:uncharacterized protein N7478_006605 [Penicillium angulare]KAJ5281233.1 hypothetical protein N7478_006605 [Penicillium angulare]
MSWTQQDAYWSRPFDCHDEMMHFLRARGKRFNSEHWMFMLTAKIGFPPADKDIVDQLRTAWKALRFTHPDIALEAHHDEKRYYPVTDEQSLESWSNETFRVEAECSSTDDFFAKHRRAPPHANATIHWIPASSEIALVSSYMLWDGRGGMLMLHEFLSTLENPVIPTVFDGAEAKKLVPSLDEVIGMPATPKPEWNKRGEELLQQYIRAQPSIGLLAPGDPKAKKPPTEMKRVETVFAPGEAKSIREAARKQNISVSTAVQTAAIIAVTGMNDRATQPENFVAWTLYDLRKFLEAPFNGVEHAPSIRLGSQPLIVKAHGSWSDISKHVDKLNKFSWDVKENDEMFVRDPFNRRATDMLKGAAAYPDLAPAPGSEPFVTSMGIFDDYIKHEYGPYSVEDVSILCQTLTPVTNLHLWSWKGTLHVSISYNVAHYDSDTIEKYLAIVKDTLRKNLL